MSTPLATLLLAVTVVGCGPRGTVSVAERALNLESFDQVWTTIRDKHFDPGLGGLDWPTVRSELRPRMATAQNAAEARAILTNMISRLGQSHCNIIPAELYGHLKQAGGDGVTGLDVRVIQGDVLVTAVATGSPAEQHGVRVGWQIESIENSEVVPVIEEITRQFGGSSWLEGTLVGAIKARLTGAVGEARGIRFLDDVGAPVDVRLSLAEQTGEKRQFGNLPPVAVNIATRVLDGGIGYITFNMFLDPVRLMPVFDRAMTDFMGADGLVIDVRGNPGGLPGMVTGMTGWLVQEKSPSLGTVRYREAELQLIVNRRVRTYGGPVAVLVDGLSGSAAELFAGGLQDLGRARVFGSRTMGAVLPSVIEKLPSGDAFQYPMASFVSVTGRVLEGLGVDPDSEVVPTRAELLAGKDPVLEAAAEWLRRQASDRRRDVAVRSGSGT